MNKKPSPDPSEDRHPSRLRLVAEIAFFISFAIAIKQVLTLVTWRYAGPLVSYLGIEPK